ncbi:glutamate synthase large subunit [Halorubellus sp. JP-L1]|uniref:glutamate synthase large subunit n=1 Tax=Halorubellus sp. JP-L1 TaxID=2715753 RepID=UPI0018780B36|nr:glutamate synthase large subunit [Halorubellus sp. JP-L1]
MADSGDDTGLADPTAARANCGVGVVMDFDASPSHDVVADGLDLLVNLEHRGTTGAEPDTGDGAGILLRRPDEFFAGVLDADLSDAYAVGSLYFPQDDAAREALQGLVAEELAARGVDVLEWRDVPTDASDLGATAREAEPDVWQVAVAPSDGQSADEFDTDLFVARKRIEHRVDGTAEAGDAPAFEHPDVDDAAADRFYVCSLDRQTLVYKGLLKGEQVRSYYPDLADERMASTFAMVHERFSTNTLGAWHLAHPYRNIVHNGEFNTLRGNVNWMRAREGDLATDAFDVDDVRPVIDDPEQSDTASIDNSLELLMEAGRDLPHALRTLVPEAWRGDDAMAQERKDFYDYHASLVEPWDGPALVAATDGERVGAVLDRNGLRPCRYDVTTDGRLVMASEAGALDVDEADVRERGRLEPGQCFLADPDEGVLTDDEVFAELTDERYAEWVDSEQVRLDDLTPGDDPTPGDERGDGERARAAPDEPAEGGVVDEVEDVRGTQAAFGYTHDEIDELVEPMSQKGKDPVGSMGDDTPLSVLSDHDRPLFSYFKQLFAQVTNPPLDYIREERVTSLETRLGRQRNLLAETPAHARQLVADSPVLSLAERDAIVELDGSNRANGLTSTVVDATYDPEATTLEAAVERIRADARDAIEAGTDVVVLSDRETGPERAAIPSLLATGGVHHHLVRTGARAKAGLVVDSGDPRTVHHHATLVGYGADAVCPYLAYETLADLTAGGDGASTDAALAAYRDALEGGLLKIMAKMGISTVESYQGAQVFEAVGLDADFVAEYFEGTENRTGGIDVADVGEDVAARHAFAFGDDPDLERQGEFRHRNGGRRHSWNPETVGALQRAVRTGDYEEYRNFASATNETPDDEAPEALRGLLEFDADARKSIPLGSVQPVHEIVERFSTAAMSLGSLSPEAHENNAVAMNRIGGKANTGEGGEPPERFDTEKECSVKQVASGRFGVTSTYLSSADEIQIKMAQGSKPGEGGHLPGEKVNEMIAHVRKSTPGVGLISPPPLHDIYSIEDLKQLIHDLKAASPDADINVKLVSEAGIGTVAAGVAKANADVVHISGHSGGTGASPKTSIKHAGLPWELGLAEAVQTLQRTGLRDRIRVTVDGGMKTGRDVAIAALLGAEEYVFGTASLVSSGCVMARQCHKNTCPVGVATQREELRERFPGEPEHVVNYMTFLAQELRETMAELGFETVEEMVGRVDCLEQRDVDHERASKLDLSGVLADVGDGPRTKVREQTHEVDAQLDWELLEDAEAAVADRQPVGVSATISNTDRAVGATLSHEVTKRHGETGLPAGTLTVDLEGTAGQSFGAFLASGVALHLRGGANDYVGKGLSGGRVVVDTPDRAGFDPSENVVAGNVALYGATDGECYLNGRAGERFAVRNSGAHAVVEGVGDHGCEYMTGGVVAVLGDVGANFAAGMSGGLAYVLDESEFFGDAESADVAFEDRVNEGMVHVEHDLDERDATVLRRLVENHHAYTGSERAAALLANWEAALAAFAKVLPDAYEEVLSERDGYDVRDSPPASATADAASARGYASSDD